MTHPGCFITFEGGDGVGKSTQIRLLAQRLSSAGVAHRLLREPGGTAVGEAIREVLLDPASANMGFRAELLLYEAARAQLVAEVISPALEAGEVVICDRFFDSTTAYQGYARGGALNEIRDLNLAATDGLVPDRTILLDIAVETGLARATAGGADRLESEAPAFHDAVRSGYRAIAAEEPSRVRVVDGTGTPDEVFARVASALADLPCMSSALVRP